MANKAKPHLLKIDKSHPFHIRHDRVECFSTPWHYHPELELNLVLESEGTRFVGDSIEPFKPNELVLLGSNLPHYWQNNPNTAGGGHSEAVILRFKKDLWGASFWELPETENIRLLFQRAARGLLFGSDAFETSKTLLFRLLHSQGGERLWLWIQLFETLALSSAYRVLSGATFTKTNAHSDSDRINKVLGYVQTHLAENIDLQTVADLSSMSVAAFCRYFKRKTSKTFTETVNELRINYACRLLLDSDKEISEICFECGFQNVSYFNQVFKAKTGRNPTAFVKAFLEER